MSDFPEVKDHLVANPDKYTMTTNPDGTVTLRPTWVDNPSEVLQEGTPVDAAFLSKIPEAIDAIDTKVTSQLADKVSQAEALTLLGGISDGTPLFAPDTTGMTDTTRNYVNTTDGLLYTHNGTAWVSTGVTYQATGINDGAVTPEKTAFFKLDTSKNLFDGNYIPSHTVTSVYTYQTSDELRKVAFIPIKPNTTYSVIKSPTNLLRVATHKATTILPGQTVSGDVKFSTAVANNYTFTTGVDDVLLVVQPTYQGDDVFLQVVEGSQTTLTTDKYATFVPQNVSVYSKDEVYAKSETYSKSEVYTKDEINEFSGKRKVKVVKIGTKLDIYIPSNKNTNYLHYEYNLVVNPEANMNQFKIQTVRLVDENLNLLIAGLANTEWEGVLKESGTSDFLGGYHGDERNIYHHMMIDGVVYDIAGSDFDIEVNNEIKIVNKSILNRCDTPGDDVFNRHKVLTWKDDEFVVENKWTALQAIRILQGYPTMLSMPREVNGTGMISHLRSNYDYSIALASDDGTGSPFQQRKDVNFYEMWGQNSGVYASVKCEVDYSKYASNKSFASNYQTNTIKIYFDILSGYNMAVGEELKSKSTYKIEV